MNNPIVKKRPPSFTEQEREDGLRDQIAGLRKYDAIAWRNYNYNDERERAVMENILVQPWPRTKR